MLALGCDHGGYNLIVAIKKYLDEKGIAYKEFGTFSEESVDYPVYAYKVAQAVVSGECEMGILCCGTGTLSCALARRGYDMIGPTIVDRFFGRQGRPV